MRANSSEHVSVDGLTQLFDNGDKSLTALSRVQLRVGWGEFVSVIGPSGCGKSTLLRVVGGLLEPSEGRVQLHGRSPREAQRNKEIGYVFQDPSLFPWRTVLANVSLPLEVNRRARKNGKARQRSPRELLELVGLEEFERYYPGELSGGMQQRVAIARALVFDPTLLLMDEPFGALDEITRQAMRYELLRIWQAGSDTSPKTVVFVTHSIPEAIALSDRVVVLSASPGSVRAVIDIDLPRPRGEGMETDDSFLRYVVQLRNLLRER
jgi:NitT/TauT family transport system ATP-binding protein